MKQAYGRREGSANVILFVEERGMLQPRGRFEEECDLSLVQEMERAPEVRAKNKAVDRGQRE